MKVEFTMNKRGTITIPIALRKSFGLNGHDRLMIEDTEECLFLHPSVSVPIEIYTEDRLNYYQVKAGRFLLRLKVGHFG